MMRAWKSGSRAQAKITPKADAACGISNSHERHAINECPNGKMHQGMNLVSAPCSLHPDKANQAAGQAGPKQVKKAKS
eukprot:scaffold329450_cov131-Tisochrysis_lutea.AAC.1